MREILFRGKDIYGKWLYGDLINLTEDLKQICNHSQLEHAHGVNPETIGQYTGLTDKNGTKIFEGDILKHPIGIFVVKFLNVTFSGALRGSTYLTFVGSIRNQCEVIGNIYDNPELLESED